MPKPSIGPTQQVTDKAKARLQRDVEYAFANVGNEFPSVTEQEFTNMVPSEPRAATSEPRKTRRPSAKNGLRNP